jgi:hypothetical protein
MRPAALNALANLGRRESKMVNMHPLHDYIASQIGERLTDRRVVVMYDKREELRAFFAELANTTADGGLVPVTVGRQSAKLHVFDGSFLETRLIIEAATRDDQPEQVVIYVPSLDRDAKGSLLMELEKAGVFYLQPALKQFARLVLRKRFTDVALDEMLKSDSLTYADLARMAQDETAAEGASLLKSVFGGTDIVSEQAPTYPFHGRFVFVSRKMPRHHPASSHHRAYRACGDHYCASSRRVRRLCSVRSRLRVLNEVP